MASKNSISNTAFPSIICAMLISFVGLFMVAPMFTPLLLSPHTNLLPIDATHLQRTLSIGFLIACYGLGLFIGGPMLGELSDQFGRKKILIVGLLILLVANLLSAISLIINSLSLLFISRIAIGFSAGMGSVMFAAISDDAINDQQRGTYIGYLVSAAAIGTIIGPIFGVRLSSGVSSFFQLYTPFLVLAGITFICLWYRIHIYRSASFCGVKISCR